MFNHIKILLVIAAGFVLLACGQQEPDAFNLQLAKQKWNRTGATWAESELQLLEKGEKLYRTNCSVCHARDGKGDLQLGAPALYKSPLANGPNPAFIKRILQGKKGTAMPAFANALTDQQVAAIASYIQNAWGNHTPGIVTAVEVKRLR